MNEEQIKLFRTVCFLASMQHGQGLTMKSPAYIGEKMKTCSNPVDAWMMLDAEAQLVVSEWADKWHFPIVKFLEKMLSEAQTK